MLRDVAPASTAGVTTYSDAKQAAFPRNTMTLTIAKLMSSFPDEELMTAKVCRYWTSAAVLVLWSLIIHINHTISWGIRWWLKYHDISWPATRDLGGSPHFWGRQVTNQLRRPVEINPWDDYVIGEIRNDQPAVCKNGWFIEVHCSQCLQPSLVPFVCAGGVRNTTPHNSYTE